MISTFFSNRSIYFFPFIITFIIFLVVTLINGDVDSNYRACSPEYARFSCGKIKNVGYPFWGGNRPQICGIPDFKLNCDSNSKNYTTMNLAHNGHVTLNVSVIDRSSQAIYVSLQNVVQKCHLFNKNNVSLLPNLKLAKNYKIIYLYYGCSASCATKYHPNYSLNCSNDDGTIGSAYYFGGTLAPSVASDTGNSSSSWCSCNNKIRVAVHEDNLDDLRSGKVNLGYTFKAPIRMEYTANYEACSKCLESGGRCGSTPLNEFVCYCRDRPHSSACPGGRKITALLIGITIGASLLGIAMLVVHVIWKNNEQKINKFSFLWSRKANGDHNVATFLERYGSLSPTKYTYANIRKMTNSFKNKLGEGGFGSVYKGKLPDGRSVAVKKLKFSKGDGKDFINEVLSMSRTNHINVVTLLGYCYEGNNRALVFEFLPNGSLEKFMHGRKIDNPLRWETMFDIAIGIAKGLDYLHRGCSTRILHFDIKPHNILLDEEFRPKISDFGLARLCPPKNSIISMSEARGTIGYIAPEVFCRYYGSVSHKSDVYSYGMMLLDLVCGRHIRNNDTHQHHSDMYFPEWIYNRLEPMEGIIDDDRGELERKMIIVSLWCIQSYPANRPSMNRVVEMLEGSLESLQIPPKPPISSSPTRFVFGSSPMITTL